MKAFMEHGLAKVNHRKNERPIFLMQALGEYTLTVNVMMWKVVYESMAISQILFENKLGVLQGDI